MTPGGVVPRLSCRGRPPPVSFTPPPPPPHFLAAWGAEQSLCAFWGHTQRGWGWGWADPSTPLGARSSLLQLLGPAALGRGGAAPRPGTLATPLPAARPGIGPPRAALSRLGRCARPDWPAPFRARPFRFPLAGVGWGGWGWAQSRPSPPLPALDPGSRFGAVLGPPSPPPRLVQSRTPPSCSGLWPGAGDPKAPRLAHTHTPGRPVAGRRGERMGDTGHAAFCVQRAPSRGPHPATSWFPELGVCAGSRPGAGHDPASPRRSLPGFQGHLVIPPPTLVCPPQASAENQSQRLWLLVCWFCAQGLRLLWRCLDQPKSCFPARASDCGARG